MGPVEFFLDVVQLSTKNTGDPLYKLSEQNAFTKLIVFLTKLFSCLGMSDDVNHF